MCVYSYVYMHIYTFVGTPTNVGLSIYMCDTTLCCMLASFLNYDYIYDHSYVIIFIFSIYDYVFHHDYDFIPVLYSVPFIMYDVIIS